MHSLICPGRVEERGENTPALPTYDEMNETTLE